MQKISTPWVRNEKVWSILPVFQGQYMLACAQESIYTKAKTGKMKHKTLASVCQQAHDLYLDVSKSAEHLSKVDIPQFKAYVESKLLI